MLLNANEFIAMNNPIRAIVQKHFEARRFLKMAASRPSGRALEIGCGRGVGVEIIFNYFGATEVDAFDLDPRMIALAANRLKNQKGKFKLWVGDAATIETLDSTYDTVFDFGIIHHIPDWRKAVTEAFRVLKPGGRFYAEEVFQQFISHPLWRRVLEHPQKDRFNHDQFKAFLMKTGFTVIADNSLWNSFGWYVADKI